MKTNIGAIAGLVLMVLVPASAQAQDKAKPTPTQVEKGGGSGSRAKDEKEGGLGSGKVGKSVSFDLPGGEKMVMKYCPGGKFTMGSPEGEKGRRGNEVQVEVVLNSHYWMAETECTQGQWEALMGNNPSEFKGKRLPVETVAWMDAQAYVSKLNETVKPPTGWRWSLPSEAQWERACRAGTTTAFSFGDDDKELKNYAWGDLNGEYRTHPVGTKKPNPWGLYDMHGNVWEWCLDSYSKNLRGGIDPVTTGRR